LTGYEAVRQTGPSNSWRDRRYGRHGG
jgi:hypothetical protein